MSLRSTLLAVALLGCAPTAAGDADALPGDGSSIVRIGEQVRLGGIAVWALRLVEDSRCPASVQCVHAGTVRLAIRIEQAGSSREAVLRLREPEAAGGGRVLWLAGVCPLREAPEPPLRAEDYRFMLATGREGESAPPPPMCAPD